MTPQEKTLKLAKLYEKAQDRLDNDADFRRQFEEWVASQYDDLKSFHITVAAYAAMKDMDYAEAYKRFEEVDEGSFNDRRKFYQGIAEEFGVQDIHVVKNEASSYNSYYPYPYTWDIMEYAMYAENDQADRFLTADGIAKKLKRIVEEKSHVFIDKEAVEATRDQARMMNREFQQV